MNLEYIKTIPSKEKKLLIYESCLIYKRLKQTTIDMTNKNKLSDVITNKNINGIKSLSLFETLLGLLSQEHQTIITNDFIEEKNEDWYKEFWSRSKYYTLRGKAIDHFVFLLYA